MSHYRRDDTMVFASLGSESNAKLITLSTKYRHRCPAHRRYKSGLLSSRVHVKSAPYTWVPSLIQRVHLTSLNPTRLARIPSNKQCTLHDNRRVPCRTHIAFFLHVFSDLVMNLWRMRHRSRRMMHRQTNIVLYSRAATAVMENYYDGCTRQVFSNEFIIRRIHD